ncbi:MAG TPA: alpha/beta family hydrolase [Thermomicrobiales bacterium]|nr:alpha/beta family hydrolase [Thermomicrobiales bacterium]
MAATPTLDVVIPVGRAVLRGMLAVPEGAQGIVAFAHGSGSSRLSPRNQEVARSLQAAGFGTLLFDLLTQDEAVVDERTREHRFDIPLLGERMVAAIDWLGEQGGAASLPIGLFGASTGAAAALVAAAERPDDVAAVVSRGGRPDLAGEALTRVAAPTLLIVGGHDAPVIGMNESAQARLRGESRLVIVPGATHLFEEPGTMEQVTDHVIRWFGEHLR